MHALRIAQPAGNGGLLSSAGSHPRPKIDLRERVPDKPAERRDDVVKEIGGAWALVGVSLIASLMVLTLCWRVAPVLANGEGTLHQDIHWMVYGYDRVWYGGRTYLNPTTRPCRQVASQFGPLRPTAARVIGRPVLAIGPVWPPPFAPTVLILADGHGACTLYALSGGP